MENGNGKIRMNVEENDRLSSLPDELLHLILSFISLKQAIQTTVLSSRWRFTWTSMPYLTFSKDRTLRDFPKFISNVLSFHDNQTQLSSVKLVSLDDDDLSLKRILSYALAHNVQQLTVVWRLESYECPFPLCILNSESLKHLNLIGNFNAPPNWKLPALTTLHLDDITLFYRHDDDLIDLFSSCTNLKNLSIKRFGKIGTFNLFHPQLSNLKLAYTHPKLVLNVVAPQLKNLTIIDCFGKHMISAPGLTSFAMKGDTLMQISTQEFCSLEKLDLCIFGNRLTDVDKIVCMLQQSQNLKFLTLNLEILEALSSSMELITRQLSVKILRFSMNVPVMVSLEVTEIKDYDTSPMVSREEIRIMKDIVLAKKLVAELWVSNKDIEEKMPEMNLREIEGLVRMLPPSGMNSWLQQIEGMLAQLPASKRAAMQPPFSRLSEEAAIVMNNMFDYNYE